MKCGECTLCCKLANISAMDSVHGEYCDSCIPNQGCMLYAIRPKHCRTFECAYFQMKKVPVDLRPDKCGVLFEKINGTLILATTDHSIEDISGLVKGQINSFIKEGISVMLQQYNPHKFFCAMIKGADRKEIIKALEDKTA